MVPGPKAKAKVSDLMLYFIISKFIQLFFFYFLFSIL